MEGDCGRAEIALIRRHPSTAALSGADVKGASRTELSFPREALFPAGKWPNFGNWG
jgi:hypothetical protein